MVTHKLENSNTELVLPLLWRFWTTPQTFQAGGSDKRTENPQEIWPWRPAGFDYRISTGLGETDCNLGGHKQNVACTRTQRKGAVTQKVSQNYLSSVGRVSWGDVSQQGLSTGTGALAAAVQEVTPWHKASWRSPFIQRAPTGSKSNPTISQ